MEDENKKKKVSILKPPKSRQPLCELDLGNQDSDDEQVTSENKTVRRVSFASNNFIKPFVADPERNTIWDVTYEESIEKSDSSHSVQAVDVRDRLNVTLINNDDDDNEMDLTENLDIIIDNRVSVVPDQENKSTTNNIENVGSVNNINMDFIDDMEFTNPISIVDNKKDDINNSNISMEETEMIPILIRETINTLHSSKLDYTCNLETAVNICNNEDNTDNVDVTMDETEMVPSSISQKPQNIWMTIENNKMGGINNLIDTRPQNISIGNETVLPSSASLCTSYDDTEKLIHFNLSNPKKSDFSKVISGDLTPSFSNLSSLPLRGINSTSFVESCMKECQQNVSETLIDQAVYTQTVSKMEGYNINASVNYEQKTTPSKCKNTDSVKSSNNVISTFESTFGDEFRPLDLTWIDNFQKNTVRIKAKLKEFTKLQQEANEIYQREIEKRNKTKEILLFIESYENELKNKQHKNLRKEDKIEEVSTDELQILTWEDKISQLHKRSAEYWNVISLDHELFKFNTLYGTIDFTVQVNDDNGQVLSIEVENCISEQSQPIAMYVHNMFMEKLKLQHIQAALGEKFEILSLLDYTRLTMENLLEIDKDLTYLGNTYAVSIDRDFSVTFAIISVNCMFSWRFAINASNYENINEESVTYYAKIGELRERDIKKCMQNCPKGFSFIRSFVENLNNFVETLENNLRK